MPQDVSRHLRPDEAVIYERFMRAFPGRASDIPPFRTDATNEIDSWVLAGEPAVWPPAPESVERSTHLAPEIQQSVPDLAPESAQPERVWTTVE